MDNLNIHALRYSCRRCGRDIYSLSDLPVTKEALLATFKEKPVSTHKCSDRHVGLCDLQSVEQACRAPGVVFVWEDVKSDHMTPIAVASTEPQTQTT